VDPLAGLVERRQRDLEGRGVADVARLVGQVHLFAGQLRVPVGAKLAVARRGGLARHPEQLAEPQVVLPQRLALPRGQLADEQLVEALGGVGDHRDRPQHQRRIHRRVWGSLGGDAGVLGQRASHLFVQFADVGEHAIGLRALAEVDLLERVAGVDEPPERRQPRVRVLGGADVVERRQRADAQRALSVKKADDVLLVDLAQQRTTAGKVAVVGQGHCRDLGQPEYTC